MENYKNTETTITFMDDDELRKNGGQGLFDPAGLKLLSSFFDPEEIEMLRKMEAEVLKWIRVDPKHAVAYLADPFGCLDQHLGLPSSLRTKLSKLSEAVKEMKASSVLPKTASIRVR